jgi:hypothetical protein
VRFIPDLQKNLRPTETPLETVVDRQNSITDGDQSVEETAETPQYQRRLKHLSTNGQIANINVWRSL